MRYKILVIISLLSVAVYANSIPNGFVYDDEIYVVENTHIRDIKNIPASFVHPEYLTSLGHKSHYRPLVMISYTINYMINGLNPVAFRLTNILFHIGTSFMLFLTVEAMLSQGGGRSEKLEDRRGADEGPDEKLEVRSEKIEDRSKKLEVRSKIKSYILHLTSYFSSGPSSAPPLSSNFYIALASALIFTVHPFNSEAVNYITARSSLMSGFFYLTALYCWVRFRQGGGEVRRKKLEVRSEKLEVRRGADEGPNEKLEVRSKTLGEGFSNFLPLTSNFLLLTSIFYLGSLLAFILGILSKEVVVTIPIVLLLYDLYFIRGSYVLPLTSNFSLLTSKLRLSLAYLPFILLIPIALVIRSVYEGGGIIPFIRRDIATQIFTGMPVLTGYLKLLFLPTGLNVAHDVKIYNTPFAFSVIISAIILIIYVINAIYLSRRKETEWRLLSYFMMWYFVTLLIIIIMPLNRIMQENRSYISGAVFAVFLGVVMGEIVYRRHGYKYAYGILAALMIIYGVGTVYRNTVWKNNVTLWKDAMEKSPYEPLTYNNLSVAYKNSGENEKAKEVLYRGLRLSPNEWLYHYNLAILYNISGELDYALLEYDRAIMINPEVQLAYVEKGNIYLQKEEIGKGMGIFQEVIQRYPEHALAHYYMAKAFHKLGRTEDAKKELELALQYAGKIHDWKLVRRIEKFKNEGFIEQGIAPEDLIVDQ